MAAEIDVVILCGGLGTRLRSVVGDRPKPMADIGGKPFLEMLIDDAERQGFRRFVLCVGHQADFIKNYFHGRQDVAIRYSEENEPLGTGGALRLSEPLTSSSTVMVLNGDSFCGIDLQGFLTFHRAQHGIGTIAVVDAADRKDGGIVEVSPNGRIVRFAEKASPHGRAWLNAGVYAFDRRAFQSIPEGRPSSLEKDVFPALLPKALFAFPTAKPLYDIGTPERLEAFRRVISSKRV